MAGKLFNIPVRGTHAHAYITSFSGFGELKTRIIPHKESGLLCYFTFIREVYLYFMSLWTLGLSRDLLELAIDQRSRLSSVLDISTEESSEGELAAMVSFAIAFPDGFMALVDTYDVKRYFIQTLLGQILSDQNFLVVFLWSFSFSYFTFFS